MGQEETKRIKEKPFKDQFESNKLHSFEVSFLNSIRYGHDHKHTYISECGDFAMKACSTKKWCNTFSHHDYTEPRDEWDVSVNRIGQSEPIASIIEEFSKVKWFKHKDFKPKEKRFDFCFEKRVDA